MVEPPSVTVAAVTTGVVVVSLDPAEPVKATKVLLAEVTSGNVRVAVWIPTALGE